MMLRYRGKQGGRKGLPVSPDSVTSLFYPPKRTIILIDATISFKFRSCLRNAKKMEHMLSGFGLFVDCTM